MYSCGGEKRGILLPSTERKEVRTQDGAGKAGWAKGQESLRKATDTLSTMLAQEVKDLNARQRAARRENSTDPGIMKGLKEATAVLKDLAGVSKTLNDQGVDAEGRECGVVLLPPVEDV